MLTAPRLMIYALDLGVSPQEAVAEAVRDWTARRVTRGRACPMEPVLASVA